jgi:glutaredoxin 2
MKHFNETELQYELKTYIHTKIREFHTKLDLEKQRLGLPKFQKQNLKEVVEKNIEIFEYRIRFYQTQLNNIK